MSLKISAISNNRNFTFRAGYTNIMKNEVASIIPQKVSREMAKRNITADFKDNKFLAWASIKCLNIIDAMNNKYKLHLGLPKGIIAEDFELIKTAEPSAIGCCNILPSNIYKDNDVIIPEKTILFNISENRGMSKVWDKIDEVADFNYDIGVGATNFFLESVIHEFSHVLHLDNMLNKLGAAKYIASISEVLKDDCNSKLRSSWSLFRNICHYAMTSPLEAVACDISKREIDVLDSETLLPKSNFIKGSPYEDKNIVQKIFDNKSDKLSELLSRYWQGKFS